MEIYVALDVEQQPQAFNVANIVGLSQSTYLLSFNSPDTLDILLLPPLLWK